MLFKIGVAATGAENLKRPKYCNLIISSYVFEPFGVETLEQWGPSAYLGFQDFLLYFPSLFPSSKYFNFNLCIHILRFSY